MIELVRKEMAEIERSLGRIEGKLDVLVSAFAEHLKEDASNFKEVNLRLSTAEKKLIFFMGALGVIWFIAPVVIQHLDKIKAFFA